MKDTFNMFMAGLLGRIMQQLLEGFMKSLQEDDAIQTRLLDPLKEWAEGKFNINL